MSPHRTRLIPAFLFCQRFAGAAEDLQEALIVNPYDIEEVAHAMRRAIEMTKQERIARHQALMGRVHQHDACNWMLSFLRALSSCRERLADDMGARSLRRRDADRRRKSVVAIPGPSGPSNSRVKRNNVWRRVDEPEPVEIEVANSILKPLVSGSLK